MALLLKPLFKNSFSFGSAKIPHNSETNVRPSCLSCKLCFLG